MTALSRSVSTSVIPKGDQPGAALSKADTRIFCFVHVVHRMHGTATAGACSCRWPVEYCQTRPSVVGLLTICSVGREKWLRILVIRQAWSPVRRVPSAAHEWC